jgi:hypothetical protein
MSLSTSNSDKSRDGAEASSHDAITVYAGEFEIVHQTLGTSGPGSSGATDDPAATADERGTFLLLDGADGLAVHEAGQVRPLLVVETESVRVRPGGDPFLRATTETERVVIERVGPVVTRELTPPVAATVSDERAAALLRANATSTAAAAESLATAVETGTVEHDVVAGVRTDAGELLRLAAEVGATRLVTMDSEQQGEE